MSKEKPAIEQFPKKDIELYKTILALAEQEGLEIDYSENEIFDACRKLSPDRIKDIPGYNYSSLTRAFLVAQSQWIYDHSEERGIIVRRHWYLRFKQFCQMVWGKEHEEKLASGELKDNKANEFGTYFPTLLSRSFWGQIKAAAKEGKILSYSNFAIQTQSNRVWKQTEYGFQNILVAGEKDSDMPLYQTVAKILGLATLYSGGGKSRVAEIENLFRNKNGNNGNGSFTHDKPLIVLTITDYDKDGLLGVESGVLKQIEFYAERNDLKVKHIRIGISPDDIPEKRKNPFDDCYILPKSVWKTSWAKKNAIWWTNEEGKKVPLGIETTACSIDYFCEKILETILEETDYTIEDMTDYARKKHTPEDYRYEEKAREVAKEMANSLLDVRIAKAKIDAMQSLIDDLEYEIDGHVDTFYKETKGKAEEMRAVPEWDDRQREWDETNEDWTDESIEYTSNLHEKIVRNAVKIKEPFIDYWKSLGFSEDELLNKLEEELKEEITIVTEKGDVPLYSVDIFEA